MDAMRSAPTRWDVYRLTWKVRWLLALDRVHDVIHVAMVVLMERLFPAVAARDDVRGQLEATRREVHLAKDAVQHGLADMRHRAGMRP
jgi:hypothetical protein